MMDSKFYNWGNSSNNLIIIAFSTAYTDMALTPAERAKRCREKRKQNVQRDAEHKSRIQIRNARYYKEVRKDPKNLERLQKKRNLILRN